MGELRANIDSVYAQGTAQMALGDLDPTVDEDWQTYVRSFQNASLERYLEVLTSAEKDRA